MDVERAVAYCQKLGLKPSQGPYLLFTTTYPDESVAPEAYTVIQVNRSAEEIGRLLDRLGDQLNTVMAAWTLLASTRACWSRARA